jgi:predicted RNase H-like HicB family nuclease
MTAKSHAMVKAINRPFTARIIKDARKIAAEYQVVLHREDGKWYGRGLELPHVIAAGKTADACIADTQQAMCAAVALLLEQGLRPPAPGRQGMRSEQIEVRLTAMEKAVLETAARSRGYRDISDFVREAALAATEANQSHNV